MALSSFSSVSCRTPLYKYDVFLSFRGDDTRKNFTSHLYATLCRKKIKTFIDKEIRRGDEISLALLDSIEGSKISVIIFSKDYASSKWCLNELVKILECKKINGQIVIPVFYHVSPSDVRKQTESFGKPSTEHERNFKEMPEMVKKWRDVLMEASYLSGHESMTIGTEAELVDAIVKDILKKLECMSIPSGCQGLVGLDSQIDEIKSHLCIGLPDVRIIGIWGMGGIGKTTLAEAIFNQISSEFESKCFMANVREKSEKGAGLEHLQRQILSQLLEENVEIRGPKLPQYIKNRLQCMKVFIVLDDVNKFERLEYLARELNQFGPGSRIIITTRDKQVLDKCSVNFMYKVKGLSYHNAFELFCYYAFRQNHCPQNLMVLSSAIVDYAQGNPLALKVLGSSFNCNRKADWENALENLNRISAPDIHDVLKISYNELSLEEKSIFLDIACFYKGEDKDYVAKILDYTNFVHYGLKVLVDKSLITISQNKLQMHDLLQEMGQEIVRQESIKMPGRRSRLWYHEDVYHVLKKNKGTDSVEGIFIDMSKIKELHLTSGAFTNMPNLRLLKFYMPDHFDVPKMSSIVHLPQGLKYLPNELRFLHWHQYPLRMLPLNFNPDNLVALSLPYSKIQQLWKGKKEASRLKFIDLHHSKCLTKMPDPSETPNLERINLLNCTNIPCISPAIQNFNKLSLLCLRSCKSLKCFPCNIHLTSPITIDLSGCVQLKEFPRISGNVIDLRLRGTAIKEVPSFIKCLTNLEKLDLSFCKRLESISTSICKLKSLCNLNLFDCSKLECFPEILEKMERLERIDLNWTKIKGLPSTIKHLEGLKQLTLSNCSKLDRLPENLGNLKSLKYLRAERLGIRELPSFIFNLNILEELSVSCCRGLIFPPLSGLSSITKLELSHCLMMEIPQDIGCLSSLEYLDLTGNNFESLPTSIKQLSWLRYLYLNNCRMLQSIPELPLRLLLLEAMNCERLQSLPELPSCLQELDAFILKTRIKQSCLNSRGMIEFRFHNCQKLNGEANNNILVDLQLNIQHMAITSLRLYCAKEFYSPPNISICIPGSGIPGWFSNQCSGSSITFQLPQHCCNRYLIGFALCAVTGFEEEAARGYFGMECRYHFETKTPSETKHVEGVYDFFPPDRFDSDFVCLGFCHVTPPGAHVHPIDVSFKFSIDEEKEKGPRVKCCGVCPVYAHPSETKPSTYTINFAATSEEECIACTEIMKLLNDLLNQVNVSRTTNSIRRSDEEEEEPICGEKTNTPGQQSLSFCRTFCNRGGFFILLFLLLVLCRMPHWDWKLAFD